MLYARKKKHKETIKIKNVKKKKHLKSLRQIFGGGKIRRKKNKYFIYEKNITFFFPPHCDMKTTFCVDST